MPGYGDTDEIQDQREVISALQRELAEQKSRWQEEKRVIFRVHQAMLDTADEKAARATRLAIEAWRQRDLASDRYRKADEAARSIYRDYCELYAAVCEDFVENVVGKLLAHETAVDEAKQAVVDQRRYEMIRHCVSGVFGAAGVDKYRDYVDELIEEARRRHELHRASKASQPDGSQLAEVEAGSHGDYQVGNAAGAGRQDS